MEKVSEAGRMGGRVDEQVNWEEQQNQSDSVHTRMCVHVRVQKNLLGQLLK